MSTDRSRPRSRRHDATASTGHTSPITISAVWTPNHSTIDDATTAPIPMNTATRLSSTPKTRASTSSGAILAISVNPARSTRALPTPMKASRPSAAACWGNDGDEGERKSPQADPDGEPGAQSPRPDEERRRERPEHRAHPDRGHQGADARLAGAQQLDRDHHGEHGERAPRQGLRRRETEDEGQVAVLHDRADTLGRLPARLGRLGAGGRGGAS